MASNVKDWDLRKDSRNLKDIEEAKNLKIFLEHIINNIRQIREDNTSCGQEQDAIER